MCFFLLSGFMNSSYILDINALSDIWFENIFLHPIGWLFILLIVSFAVQKFFSLMKSHFLNLMFVVCAFDVIQKEIIAKKGGSSLCFSLGVLYIKSICSCLQSISSYFFLLRKIF